MSFFIADIGLNDAYLVLVCRGGAHLEGKAKDAVFIKVSTTSFQGFLRGYIDEYSKEVIVVNVILHLNNHILEPNCTTGWKILA